MATAETAIDKAFDNVPRENFLPADVRMDAELDMPLPIGYGVTNSQPSTVRKMLEWLDVKPGQNVLDVGSGSGWTSALIGDIVGKQGNVVAVDRVPDLVTFGRENCKQTGITNVSFHKAGKTFGYKPKAPYDRILVSATASKLPHELTEQLKPGGKLVIPIKSSILVVTKTKGGSLDVEEHPGFSFVPLLED